MCTRDNPRFLGLGFRGHVGGLEANSEGLGWPGLRAKVI